jgi:hypothetical protein
MFCCQTRWPADGSFPQELRRSKPYGYSIFNLDAMATICQMLSSDQDNLWTYQTTDGRSIKKGIEYLYPFIADKTKWPHKQDVMYWENWPVAQPFLLFGADAYKNKEWFNTWKKLDHSPTVDEVQQQPVTVTAQTSSRSAGGKHDFFSEGDYWWPNPVSVDSPYIQKDGMTNPDNFVAHRQAMIRFSRLMGALGSAYKITGDDKYVRHALLHCKHGLLIQ